MVRRLGDGGDAELKTSPSTTSNQRPADAGGGKPRPYSGDQKFHSGGRRSLAVWSADLGDAERARFFDDLRLSPPSALAKGSVHAETERRDVSLRVACSLGLRQGFGCWLPWPSPVEVGHQMTRALVADRQ